MNVLTFQRALLPITLVFDVCLEDHFALVRDICTINVIGDSTSVTLGKERTNYENIKLWQELAPFRV